MKESLKAVAVQAEAKFGDAVSRVIAAHSELTLEIKRDQVTKICRQLRDDPDFAFSQLTDLCGIDYLTYRQEAAEGRRQGPRFAVVYQLLSLKYNHRLRLRSFLDDELPMVASVVDIWNSANWYEREAFDLFGIVFEGHPDLRRILTDYGFIGHPFRKDFPLSGEVEMRYDAEKQRVVYQPVSIEPRINVPRVIRVEGFGDRNP